ncbi:MAG: HlyD family efflux transporter periplasmic adaptor subunit [Kofleriaceae bacterium]
MKSGLGDFVRRQGYCPALRDDIRFYREGGKDIVLVHDPLRDRRYQLYENECLIAREMNGKHDLDALTQVARKYLPWATRNHVEQLAIQIAEMGLLTGVPAQVFARPSAPVITTRPSVLPADDDIPRDYSEGLEDWTQLTDAPTVFPVAPPPTIVIPPVAAAPEPEPVFVEQAPESPAPVGEPPQADAWEVEKPGFVARHRRAVYAGVAVLVVLALAIIPYPLYITEPCNVRPVDRAQVRSQIDGVITSILVREGDRVQVGTPLARLEDRDLAYALVQANATVEKLNASLSKVRTGNRPEEKLRAKTAVNARAQDARFASIEATRFSKLFKQGVASATQRDEAARNLALKQSELSQAMAELKLVESGSRSEEVTIAEAELKRAQAEVTFLTKKMELLTIRAPIAGRVLTPRFQERLHARLSAGDEVCEIGSSGDMLVEVFVDEAEADILQVGQAVSVKVRSYPLESFRGTVDLIAPAVIEAKDGRRILRVDVRVDNSSGLLQPQMTGYAEIDAGSQTVLGRVFRRGVRWIRVRFLI